MLFRSSTPSIDVLITLLHLGMNVYKNLLKERKELFNYLKQQMVITAQKFGSKVLENKNNQISIAMTLDMFQNSSLSETEIGSMLFIRSISGTRVVSIDGKTKTINGYQFQNWGSHTDDYKHSYITAAAAIGVTKQDINHFIKKLNEVLLLLQKKKNNNLLTKE